MARIRSVKPEFWSDPDIVDLPMAARLFFIGTWNHADDFGVLKDEPARLKMQILPADDVDPYELVEELVQSNLLTRRVAPDGTNVLVIRTFLVHQKIDKRSEGRWGNPEDFTEPPPIPTNPSEAPRAPTNPAPGRELVLGGEGTGTEGTSTPCSNGSLALVPSASPTRGCDLEDQLFDHWWARYPRKVGKQAARRKYASVLLRGVDPPTLFFALETHIDAWTRHRYEQQFIPHPATWLNEGRWEDDPPGPRGAATRAERNDDILDAFLKDRNGGAA